MKAVRHFTHNIHNVFIALAILVVLAAPVSSVVSLHSAVVYFGAAIAVALVLFEIDSWSEHFVHDKF